MVKRDHNPCSNADKGTNRPNARKYSRKQPWSDEEDTKLAKLVNTHGLKRWSVISSLMVNRTAKQCRERWKHQLDPKINTASWTINEEWMLYLQHAIIGNRWVYLVNFFPGRTDNSIKNHWNTQMRKRIPKYEEKLNSAIKLFEKDVETFRNKFTSHEAKLIERIAKNATFKCDFDSKNEIFTDKIKDQKAGSEKLMDNEIEITQNYRPPYESMLGHSLPKLQEPRLISSTIANRDNICAHTESPNNIRNSERLLTNQTPVHVSIPQPISEQYRDSQSPNFMPRVENNDEALNSPLQIEEKFKLLSTKNLTPVFRLGFQIVSPNTPESARLSDSEILSNFKRLRAASKDYSRARDYFVINKL